MVFFFTQLSKATQLRPTAIRASRHYLLIMPRMFEKSQLDQQILNTLESTLFTVFSLTTLSLERFLSNLRNKFIFKYIICKSEV